MILEARDNDNRTGKRHVIAHDVIIPSLSFLSIADDDREQISELIENTVHSGMLNPGDQWHTIQHDGRSAQIKYKVRVRCEEHYYGFNCTKFCRPRNGFFGHHTCDHNGHKKCLDGWIGQECNIGNISFVLIYLCRENY